MRSGLVAALLPLGLLLLASSGVHAIYPDGHFDGGITKLEDSTKFLELVNTSIDAGKAVFAPAWNFATSLFEGNTDIVFGDVNLKDGGPRGPPHNPGSGGWPTIRYFTKETTNLGAGYTKKTDKSVCDELGNRDNMVDYIEDFGQTALCGVDGKNCNGKEAVYLEKWKAKSAEDIKAQEERLGTMLLTPMKEELEVWVFRRRRILKKLIKEEVSGDGEL